MSILTSNRFVIFSAQKDGLATVPPSYASVQVDSALVGTVTVMANACKREGVARLINLQGPDCWGGGFDNEEGIGADRLVVTADRMWFEGTTFEGVPVKTDPVEIKELVSAVREMNKTKEVKVAAAAQTQWSPAEKRFYEGLLDMQKQTS